MTDRNVCPTFQNVQVRAIAMKVIPIKQVVSDGCDLSLSLTIGRPYEVLGIGCDSYRLLTDPNAKPYGSDPVLFDPAYFRVSDANWPTFWINEIGEEGSDAGHYASETSACGLPRKA